nr:MAG TPA: hypothetical protein [Caudoviricetes sp.]
MNYPFIHILISFSQPYSLLFFVSSIHFCFPCRPYKRQGFLFNRLTTLSGYSN